MYDYKLLEAFAAVIEYGGFEKASEKLFITQSAVSQRVKLLEEQSRSVLLVRSNPPAPTEAGQKFIAHFNKVRLLEDGLERELTPEQSDDYISLSIGLNADTLSTWFFDAVADTAMKHRILLNLRVDDQEETHRLLKNGETAGCISTRSKPMQGCSAKYLCPTVYRMFVAPDKKDIFFPEGFTEPALKSVPVIVYNEKDTLHTQLFQKAFGKIPQYKAHFIPSVEKYLDAVVRGMGIGMMPHHQCDNLLRDGILADAAAPHTVEAHLYWHRWNISSKPLDIVTDSLIKYFRR